jgi:alpha-L-rhamnosidase
MNSFNHYALGSVGEFMYRNLGGINVDPEQPAYKHTVIRPRPGAGLSFVKASYASVRGPIETEWRNSEDVFTLRVSVPPGTTATVYVPATSESAVMEGNVAASHAPGVKFERSDNGSAVFRIGSGHYEFMSKARAR